MALQTPPALITDIPRPRFLLRVPDFTIVEYNRPSTKDDVESLGYGIISYTWGRFQDKTQRETSPLSPRFHSSIPEDMHWHFPKLGPEGFTMENVRRILEKIEMKYVWWDWACIPQFWDSNGTVDPLSPTGKTIGYLKDEYKVIKDEEVSKQLFIYTLAVKGFIWLHGTTWTHGDPNLPQSDLERLLLRMKRMPPADYLTLLRQVKDAEKWFSSMWTFQEGILLNVDEVIDPRSNQVIVNRELEDCAILVDRNGEALEGEMFFRGERATLFDLTAKVTLQYCAIAGWLQQALSEETPPPHLQNIPELQRLLMGLNETGLVAIQADAPLLIIEASRARGGNFTSSADFSVNALLGALQVILPPDTSTKDIETRKLALMAALVERYSWRMVLLCKPTRGRLSYGSIEKGIGDWISILGMDWKFCTIGHFIQTNIISKASSKDLIPLPKMVHTSALYPGSKLDGLVVGPDPPDSKRPYVLYHYDLITGSKGWMSCQYYATIPNPNYIPPRGKQFQCVIKSVPYDQAREAFGTDSIVLLPLERVLRDRSFFIRCAILAEFHQGSIRGSAASQGIFVGIGDFDLGVEELDEMLDQGTNVRDLLGDSWRIYIY